MAAAAPHATRRAPVAEPSAGARAPAARALLAALAGCVLVAAFAGGATGLPEESWVQLALALTAAAACAAWLYGGGIALAAPRTAWIGVGLLAAYALWCGASIAWSVAPDRSWVELNRGLAYALTAVLGLAAGASPARGPARACAALAFAGAVVALYALAGKTLPGLALGGFDLDQAGEVSRLRAPLGYWNALGLACAMAVAPALAVVLDARRHAGARLAGLLSIAVLIVVLALTYSRGALVALLVGVVVMLALGGSPLRVLAALLPAAAAAAAPIALAVRSADLTADGLPLARREDDALLVALVLLVALALLAATGRALLALEARGAFTRRRDRVAGVLVAVALAAGVIGATAATAASSGGLRGAWNTFATPQGDATTDPQRVLSTSSGNRWVWWKEAAGAWSDRPLAGWGAGSFPVTHLRYRQVDLNVRQPHSMPLQWLAETGAAGLLLVGGGLLALLAAALARVRRTPSGPGRLAGAALVATAATWIVHALYDWDWDIPGVTLPMLVALGVAAARPAAPAVRRPAVRGPGLAIAAAVLIAFAVSALLPALAATRAASALDAAARADEAGLAAAAGRAELAARLNPLSVEPFFATASIARRLGDLGQAHRQLLRAVERQPENAEAWARLLQLELARGDRAAVGRVAERLVELDPRGAGVRRLAERAQAYLTPPAGSATATGSPLPQPAAPPIAPPPVTPPEAATRPPTAAPPAAAPSPTAAPPAPSPSPTP